MSTVTQLVDPTRLKQIGTLLAELHRRRYDLRAQMLDLNQQRERRALELVPPEGWPGKNAEARTHAEKAALQADEEHQRLTDAIHQNTKDTFQADGQILALNAEQDSLEWIIRWLEAQAHLPAAPDSAPPPTRRPDPPF